MTKVTSEELSALLDGELGARRASEVRAAIAADPVLRAEHEALETLHGVLEQAGARAAFMPKITLPAETAPRRRSWYWAAPVALPALLAVRFAPKLLDPAMTGLALQLGAMAIILAAIVRMTRAREGMAAIETKRPMGAGA